MKEHTGLGKSIGLMIAGMLLVAVPLALGSYLLFGNWLGDDKVEGKVLKELPRPGGGLTAILVKYEGWDDFVYRLYMRRGYDNTTWMEFWTDNNYGAAPDIAWTSPDSLVIRMQCGDIGKYKNNFEYQINGKGRVAFIGLENNKLCLKPK